MSIQTGDILFRTAINSELSRAINAVTQSGHDYNYTHMGIATVSNGETYVYHADPVHGVCCQPLALFRRSDQDQELSVDVFRLRPEHQALIPAALSIAQSLLGQPYNHSYIIGHEGHYCSEFIYQLFADAGLFTLEPMTFKQADSDTFHPGWISHYRELQLDIPEGQPGCNPNTMAMSKELIRQTDHGDHASALK